MEHIPITESDVQKIIRIAKVLDISIEDATITCDAFHLAFSDDRMRRAIFEMIDELDDEAYKKGEACGLIINYTVELDREGIRVGRYADEIPAGEVVNLTPTDRAMIFLKIKDNFPTQQFLGPLIVNRPELPSLAKEGWQTDVFCRADGVVRSDSEMKEPAIPLGPSSLEPVRGPICLGPIRLTFNERFSFITGTGSRARRAGAMFGLSGCSPVTCYPLSVTSRHHLPPWAALPAEMPAFQWTSGLSPPSAVGDRGHSASKDVPGPWQ